MADTFGGAPGTGSPPPANATGFSPTAVNSQTLGTFSGPSAFSGTTAPPGGGSAWSNFLASPQPPSGIGTPGMPGMLGLPGQSQTQPASGGLSGVPQPGPAVPTADALNPVEMPHNRMPPLGEMFGGQNQGGMHRFGRVDQPRHGMFPTANTQAQSNQDTINALMA